MVWKPVGEDMILEFFSRLSSLLGRRDNGTSVRLNECMTLVMAVHDSRCASVITLGITGVG